MLRRAAQDLRGDELAQHARRPVVADRTAQQRRGRAADRGVPDAQERADQPFADAVHAAGGDLRYELRRVDRQLHGGDEQLVLGAEVVVDQRRVDPGAGSDVTDGGSVVSLLGERLPRGGQDGLAGVLVARAASGTGHGYAVRRRRVAAPPSRASRMQPTTIVTSRHIVVVGLTCSRTWMSASTAYVMGITLLIFSSQPA